MCNRLAKCVAPGRLQLCYRERLLACQAWRNVSLAELRAQAGSWKLDRMKPAKMLVVFGRNGHFRVVKVLHKHRFCWPIATRYLRKLILPQLCKGTNPLRKHSNQAIGSLPESLKLGGGLLHAVRVSSWPQWLIVQRGSKPASSAFSTLNHKPRTLKFNIAPRYTLRVFHNELSLCALSHSNQRQNVGILPQPSQCQGLRKRHTSS